MIVRFCVFKIKTMDTGNLYATEVVVTYNIRGGYKKGASRTRAPSLMEEDKARWGQEDEEVTIPHPH